MIKLLALLRSLPSLSRADVIEHYETHHAPLIRSIMPGILDYRRNYLEGELLGCDILTELWFADRTSFDRAMAAAGTAENSAKIAADEARFLDSAATRLMVAEEHGAPGLR